MHDQRHVSRQQTPEVLFSDHEEMRLVQQFSKYSKD